MKRELLTELAKTTGNTAGSFVKRLGLGKGTVIPGRVGLTLNPELLKDSRRFITKGVIYITGTNGKSSTTNYLSKVLKRLGHRICTNSSGSNMISGIASVCLNLDSVVDYAIFEVDEGSLRRLSKEFPPTHIVVLNLSRDQLDRYAEIESITNSIIESLTRTKAELIYNFGNLYASLLALFYPNSYSYFVESGLDVTLDIPACPFCQIGLLGYIADHSQIVCSQCSKALLSPSMISYNKKGLLHILRSVIGSKNQELSEMIAVTVLTCLRLGHEPEAILQAVKQTPIVEIHKLHYQDKQTDRHIYLALGKNPDSLNRNILSLKPDPKAKLVLAINENMADGTDSSWLWDVYFERLRRLGISIMITGQATADLALRLKIAHVPYTVIDKTKLTSLLQTTERLIVLANYTAFYELESMFRKLTANQNSLPKYMKTILSGGRL